MRENRKEKLRELLRSAYPANDNSKKKAKLIAFAGVIFATGFIATFLLSNATFNSGLLIQQEGDHNIGVLIQEIKPEIHWTDLTPEMREKIRAQGFILFPEILDMSKHAPKWEKPTSWLYKSFGIKHNNPRDLWRVPNDQDFPGFLARLLRDKDLVFHEIGEMDGDLLTEYWRVPVPSVKKDRIIMWLKLIDDYVINQIGYVNGMSYLKRLSSEYYDPSFYEQDHQGRLSENPENDA